MQAGGGRCAGVKGVQGPFRFSTTGSAAPRWPAKRKAVYRICTHDGSFALLLCLPIGQAMDSFFRRVDEMHQGLA